MVYVSKLVRLGYQSTVSEFAPLAIGRIFVFHRSVERSSYRSAIALDHWIADVRLDFAERIRGGCADSKQSK